MIGTNLGAIYAELKLDTSGLSIGVQRAQREIADMGNQLTKHADAMVNAGNRLTTGLTLPLLGIGIAAGKMSMDFGEAIAKIQGLAGAGADSIGGIRKSIEEMAPVVAKGPKELADAMYFIYSAGIKGDAAIKVLNASAKAASAGLGDVKTVADAVTSAVNAYGQQNITAAHATDVLVAAVREGKVESSAMAGAIGKVLPVASNMGVSFDNVAAAMASMTRSGLNADEAATAIRQTLASLLKPGKQAQDALASVGLSASELRRELSQNLIAGLQHLAQAFNGNDEALARVFPNVRALTGVLNLTGQSAENVSRIFNNVMNSTGATDQAFKTMEETTGHKLKSALVSLQVDLVKLGDSAAPAIVALAGAVGTFGHRLAALPPDVLATIVAVAALVAAIGPALAMIGNIAKLIGLLGELGSVFVTISSGAGPVVLAIGALGAAIYGVVKLIQSLKKEAADETRVMAENARLKNEQAQQTKALVSEYEQLRDKTNRSATESSRMQEILQKISETTPQYITGYDKMGRPLGILADSFARVAAEAENARQKALWATKQENISQRTNLAEQQFQIRGRVAQRTAAVTSGRIPGEESGLFSEIGLSSPLNPIGTWHTLTEPEKAKLNQSNAADRAKLQELDSQLNELVRQSHEMMKGILPSSGPSKVQQKTVDVSARIASAKKYTSPSGLSPADRAVMAQENAVEALNQKYDAASQKFDRMLKASDTSGATQQLEEMNRLTISLAGAEDKLAEAKKRTNQQDSTKKKPLPKTAEERGAIDLQQASAVSQESERYLADKQKLADKKKELSDKALAFDKEQRDKELRTEEAAQNALIQLYETTGDKEAAIRLRTQSRIKELQSQGLAPLQALVVASAEAEKDLTALHDEQTKKSVDLFESEVRNQVELLDYKRRYNLITVDEYAAALNKMKTATAEVVGDQSTMWIDLTDKTASAYADQADKIIAQSEITARGNRKAAYTMLQDQLAVYRSMGDAGVQAAKAIEDALYSMQKRDAKHVKDWVEAYQAALGQISRSFENTVTDWITGTNTFKDFWKQVWRDIVAFAVHALIQLASEWVKTQVLVKKGLASMGGSGSSSGVGSTLLGGLGAAIAGPVGGAIGTVLGKWLKFDDPINDTWAVRVGQMSADTARSRSDFTRLFSQGLASRVPVSSSSGSPAASSVSNEVHVHMNIDKVTGVGDLEKAADSMAWLVTRKLRLTPTGA